MGISSTLAMLIFGHALADFGLQSKYISDGKDRANPIEGSPWYIVMSAHAVMHAGFVFLFTGSLGLGIAELVVHFIIDDRKCQKDFGYATDQALHILCKVLWVAILFAPPHWADPFFGLFRDPVDITRA